MATWLLDLRLGLQTGRFEFRLPYPLPGQWARERRINQPLLLLMRHALQAYEMFKVPQARWGPDHWTYYQELLEQLEPDCYEQE